MLDSHRITPLAAYDTKANIIAPNDYRSKLMGAVVRATISLNIGTSVGKTLTQPTSRVLVPPKPMSYASPPKRKVAPKDPGNASGSPKKCTRT
ncbi:hypothetical protein B0H17DRAFT_1061267 [Mycena rosella]|uniref:Uncharacterized protein n=1 Tax=Mycena rosella TaxID=1033263 RepID=A0AAD7GJX4_MYCRO|nr:hypothetical protein B0H17DRAFT_1061267 [Mycena rosella]